MMVAESPEAGLLGRGKDHHCRSDVFRGTVDLMQHNMLKRYPPLPAEERNGTIRVLWSSREPYCCRPEGNVYTPKRSIKDEEGLLTALRQRLGDGYDVISVNFGSLSALDSVRAASSADIIAGVHGAGLVWSVFLRGFGGAHGGVVEVFG